MDLFQIIGNGYPSILAELSSALYRAVAVKQATNAIKIAVGAKEDSGNADANILPIEENNCLDVTTHEAAIPSVAPPYDIALAIDVGKRNCIDSTNGKTDSMAQIADVGARRLDISKVKLPKKASFIPICIITIGPFSITTRCT